MSWKTNEAYTSKIKYKCMSKEVILGNLKP
jgi:hypothetical protein